jgi:AcrR family transcriptional regulator
VLRHCAPDVRFVSRAVLADVASSHGWWHNEAVNNQETARSVPRTARERARAEITGEILAAARRHLATDGAPALSLRAIARDLGMASSAVYRYVASRDELLTRLIIDAYDSLGSAAEAAESPVARDDMGDRWSAVCRAVRGWALAHPNEYALIYGSPVPGYVAPPDTIAPATRVANLLVRILVDATVSGSLAPAVARDEVSAADRSALSPIRSFVGIEIPDALIQRGIMAWSALYGAVSFELFGQLHNVVGEEPGDREAYFAECVRRWAEQIGIAQA